MTTESAADAARIISSSLHEKIPGLMQTASNLAILVDAVSDLAKITKAARMVIWQRYHTDPNNTLGKEFPDISNAIFSLGNIVGLPSTEEDV